MSSNVIGRPVLRVEDPPLLVGAGNFVANRDLDNALVVHYVVSIAAHAMITDLDVADAKTMPGVVDVVTAADLEADGMNAVMAARMPGLPEEVYRRPMATDRVRFVGEVVAAVIAETDAQAADAAEAVWVDYEPLPAVLDPLTAGDAETLLFPDIGTNVIMTATGGTDEPYDFNTCEAVVEVATVNQRLAACPIEGRVGAAYWDDDGRLIQYASCQGAHPIRANIARHYGLDLDQVRVITADVGGSFGAKSPNYPEDLLLGYLSRRTGRPVRWAPNRSDDMLGLGHSRGQHQQIKIGGRRDGTIEAIEAEITGDCGAYPASAHFMMRLAGLVIPGPFEVANVHWKGKVVATNTTPMVAYRGAGRPEGAAMLNRGIDAFAREIGMDTLDVMRKNAIKEEDLPWTSPTGLIYDSGDYGAALELAAREVGHDALRARQAQERAEGAALRTGIGWTAFVDRTAGIPGDDWGSAELRPDGSLQLLTSSSPYGQGHYTAWAMLAAERTGIPMDRINVFHGDTDVVPKGPSTSGSRSAQRAGVAVAKATDELVELAKATAANLLEASVDDVVLDIERGEFHVSGAPGAAAVDWAAIGAATLANDPGGEASLQCESDSVDDGPSVPFGVYAAVVLVDTETGHVKLEKIVSVDDAGAVINPLLVEGQLHGAIAQGLGQALFEEFIYDEDGNPLTGTFIDYCIPSAADMPSFDVYVVEHPTPNNPLGAKGVAESGCLGAPPAIQNAVIDALSDRGVRHIDMPLSPEKVWAAMNAAR